ncbi:3-phosphoshikimate 1-carboxyvinyltransferase [Candidatus Peregrinibacteria bacterium]|nr:3-phosphoshikimate 1-carboxyvinyltransferase [Candidatus Peregrinibacteria bacterium]
MNKREVIPLKQKPDLCLTLPGSKSITNRALLCAALATGTSRIYGALKSDDSEVMQRALKQFGVGIRKKKDCLEIAGRGGKFRGGKVTVDLHNAGTATRFLTAISVFRPGETIITGNQRMQERPIADLVEGLRQLGADIQYMNAEGCPPLTISGLKLPKKLFINMKGDKSSQYFSSLFMLGPLLGRPLKIRVVGELVSKPYIDTTIAVMKAFGVSVKNNQYKSFEIRPQKYKKANYRVEGDASSASYFSALHFLHGGKLKFTNLDYKRAIQGDANFPEALEKLKKGSSRTINMESMPDAAMTLAVCAAFAKGSTKITGLSTLRIKETDRLAALKNELCKVGVKASITNSSITVSKGEFKPANVETYNDHRMAMCFAVLGTKVPSIVIENPDCTDKTYPNFWEDLEKVYLAPIKLGQKNLLLTGMRCSGKTFHGKRLAKKLGRMFVDLDQEIEKTEKMKIDKVVRLKGWPYFRKIEQKICSKFEGVKNLVIAAGGGVVLSPKNMKALKKNSVNVFIFADSEILAERIKKDQGRPSLTGEALENEIHLIWEERRDLYLKYADYVWDDTNGNSLQKPNFFVC